MNNVNKIVLTMGIFQLLHSISKKCNKWFTRKSNAITNRIFEDVYKDCVWGQDINGNGTSGYGSELQFNKDYIQFMIRFIIHNKIKTVADIGCGDWQFSNEIYKCLNISYYGYDCVEHIINNNIQKYRHVPNYHFKHINGDNILSQLDCKEYDLLILKDVIQHWPNTKIISFLQKLVKTTSFKYILLVNDHTSQENTDIAYGWYRPLNWHLPPFNQFNIVKIFDFNTFDNKTAVLLLQEPNTI